MRALLLPLVLALLLPACSRKEAPAATVTVTRGPLVAEQSFYGELTPKKSTPIPVPKVPRVDTLTVKTVLADGAVVKQGDVVATLDTSDLEENLRTTLSDLAVAQAERQKTEQALITERITLELEQKRRMMAVEEAKLRLVEGVNLISELDRKKAEVRARLEAAAQAKKGGGKKGFMTPARKKKLRVRHTFIPYYLII